MTRYVHHDVREIHVIIRGPDGAEVWRHRTTGLVGSPKLYGMMLAGARARLRAGETVDSSEADAEHARLLAERDAAVRAVHASSA